MLLWTEITQNQVDVSLRLSAVIGNTNNIIYSVDYFSYSSVKHKQKSSGQCIRGRTADQLKQTTGPEYPLITDLDISSVQFIHSYSNNVSVQEYHTNVSNDFRYTFCIGLHHISFLYPLSV